MNDYFDNDGHLTTFALRDLINGEPAELARLEIAEHLSFCDLCTEHYTDLMCGGLLLDVPEPLERNVLARIRQRSRTIFLNRYVAAGVAACFTMVLWLGGAFTPKLEVRDTNRFDRLSEFHETFTDKTAQFGETLSDSINGFFEGIGNIDLKGVFQNEKK